MLTDEQLDDITARIEEFLDPIAIAESGLERCDYGCRMHTVITPVAQQLTRDLAPLIEQWLADALTCGPLPEGWERREEGCFNTFGRTGMCHSRCPGGTLCCCPRTTITGPWSDEERTNR